MPTLSAHQHNQTEAASPDTYTAISSSPFLSPSPSLQCSQTGTASPNTYAHRPSAQPNGDGITKWVRSQTLSVAKRKRLRQMGTLRAAQRR